MIQIILGDSLSYMNGMKFSAIDFDQDTSEGACASAFKGGWWYAGCHAANPNGLYLRGNHSSYANGVNWKKFRGHHHSMKKMELKIRKKN